jgi:hypothetical protein
VFFLSNEDGAQKATGVKHQAYFARAREAAIVTLLLLVHR